MQLGFAKFFKQNIGGVVIFLISFYLCLANYVPGTFLTGWDTLHPEFNFSLYWERIIDGVWQEHQGLGAVATQAHASEIPRVMILHILNLFMELNQIRYAYAFLMLILGPLGVYFLIKKALIKNVSQKALELGAFSGALFYLLNLGTLQHFYAPLEMFLTHYGLLAWVFLFAIKFFEVGDKRNILYFCLASFFIIPQAHTATLFYAFILIFCSYFLTQLIQKYIHSKIKKESISRRQVILQTHTPRFLILFLYTFLLNSFWFLPNMYFVLQHGTEIRESKIHHLFSEEAFLQNKEFGNIKDTALLKNFLFNWGEHIGGGQFGDLLDEWNLHLSKPYVELIGYLFFLLICLGTILTFTRSKNYSSVQGMVAIALVSMFFIFNVNPPLGFAFQAFQNAFPIFKEAFRFPFTKFSIGLILAFSVLFAVALSYIGEVLYEISIKNKKSKAFGNVLYAIIYSSITFGLIWFMLPAFQGNLISKSMKVNIPSRYFEMFNYLNEQKEYGRVANLPIHSFWGWVYHNWDVKTKLGYQGAGFLWFGIKQPLMDREFDRWNLLNEQYYRDFSTAIYSKDVAQLESILSKYKIKWVLFDTSILAPSADQSLLYYPQIRDLLASSTKIKLEKTFGEGLFLYKYDENISYSRQELVNEFVYSDDSLFKEYGDTVFSTYGTYIKSNNYNRIFPFIGITNFDESISKDVISSDENNIYFKNKLSDREVGTENKTELVDFNVYALLTNNTLDIMMTNSVNISPEVKVIASIPLTNIQENFINNYVLNIGETHNFYLNTIDSASEYVLLGNALLKPSASVPIKVMEKHNLASGNLNLIYNLEKCSGVGEGSSYTLSLINGGFKLLSKDLVTCVTVNLSQLVSVQSLKGPYLEVSYDAEDLGSKYGTCILDSSTGLCINTPIQENKSISYIDNQRLEDYYLRFLSDNLLNKEEAGVAFSNISLATLKVIYEDSLDLSSLAKIETQKLDVLTFHKDKNYGGNVTERNSNANICNTGQRNFENSQATIQENYIRYDSYKDSLCDSFQFPYASHNLGYILEVRARNITGLPLRVCVTNETSKRCDLYVSLAPNKDFDTQYFFIPPMDDTSGYTINFSNLVFGSDKSINDLEYISLSPFPYNYLQSINTQTPQMPEGKKLFVLNEAYDPGWVAICGIFPCNKSHTVVNNWANGWVLESDFDTANIKVIFWPQVLEYIGFILTIIVIGFTLLHKPKEG